MWRLQSGVRQVARRTFAGFTRLGRDERGNTLIIAAAILIPLLGLVGSGIDLSRTYLARNKLQQACDAGVLAGRKVYVSSVDANVTSEVRKFVNFNFPQGTSDTAAFTITPTAGADGAVDLALATTINMSIMKVFGFNTLAISASCTGRQDFVNTDVMLVLDTTGSMNCLPGDSATANCPNEKNGAKIQALRSAVSSFYNALKPAQDQLETNGLRLRYGIIPYSSTVNVGKLLLASGGANWLNQSSNYRNNCVARSNGACTNSAQQMIDHGTVSASTTFWKNWPGCIEERQTISSIDQNSGYTPSSSAYDLDLSMVPSSDPNTKWNAMDTASQSAKNNGANANAYNACPSAAKNVAAIPDVSTLNSYTSGLVAIGGTYHDIGMIWGGRLLSTTGIYANNNPTSFNNFPVNRHLIFMTDGAPGADIDIYGAYGIERLDKRVTGTGNANTQDNSHQQRFRMMCNAIKGQNISIWVIAFGTSSGTGLSQDMIDCASSPAQAFKADDQATLIQQFTQIGQSIGALRLSQ